VDEIAAFCPYINGRIMADWWTQAYNYVIGRGGFIPSHAVINMLNNIDFVQSYMFDSTLGLSNPLVDGSILRGYIPSAAELTAVYAAMDAAQACILDYMAYTTSVASPLTTPTANDNAWYNARMPTECAWEYADSLYAITPSRAVYLFEQWKLDVAAMIPVVSAQMAALVPDYMGYNLTALHLNAAFAAANNLTFIGYPTSWCTGPTNVYSNGTNYQGVLQMAGQKIQENQQLQRTVGTTARYTLVKNPCSVVTLSRGLSTSVGFAGRDPNLPEMHYIQSTAPVGYFINGTTWIMAANVAFTIQRTFAKDSACEQCFTRRLSTFHDYSTAYIGLVFGFGATYQLNPRVSRNVVIYGNSIVSSIFTPLLTRFFTPEEQLNADYYFIQARYIEAVTYMGYWARANGTGWADDTECGVWRQNNAWLPQATLAAAISSCATAASRAPGISSTAAVWNMNGMQITKDYLQLAQAACGPAFDGPYFMSLAYSHGLNSLHITNQIYEDYIGSGCQKTITERGDCWRNVAPPKPVI